MMKRRSKQQLTIHGKHEGKLINLVLSTVSRFREPVGVLMPKRFRNAVKEETHGDTRREKHHEVGTIIKLGLLVLFTELNVTVANRQPKDKKGKLVVSRRYESTM